jgi:hypothetical protein
MSFQPVGIKENKMMYNEKLASCIKVNGRILREQKDVVRLPFGSEYSILLKNLNPVRVQFKLEIDGIKATDDTWIVIPANSSVEMERFIKNGNFDTGNKFKFIERSAEVEAHRGIGVEDGLIRIEYKKEHVVHYTPPPFAPPVDRRRAPWNYPVDRRRGSGIIRGSGLTGQSCGFNAAQAFSQTDCALNSSGTTCDVAGASAASAEYTPAVNEAGITVEGSKSDQSFTFVPWFATEVETFVMVLHLKGQVKGQPITHPVTVEKKPVCSSCGKTNKGNAQFCSACGTSLVSYA